MKSWKVIFVLIVAMLFCGVVSAYTDYGNGVLYFVNPELGNLTGNYRLTPDTFGEQLSLFINQHPNLKIDSIFSWPDTATRFNSAAGFYVIVENKSVMKMSCVPSQYGHLTHNTMTVNYTCTEE